MSNSLNLFFSFLGAIHADELGYFFKQSSITSNLPPTAPEVVTKNRMVRFIGNFMGTFDTVVFKSAFLKKHITLFPGFGWYKVALFLDEKSVSDYKNNLIREKITQVFLFCSDPTPSCLT